MRRVAGEVDFCRGAFFWAYISCFTVQSSAMPYIVDCRAPKCHMGVGRVLRERRNGVGDGNESVTVAGVQSVHERAAE
jgi:hypothetical protein